MKKMEEFSVGRKDQVKLVRLRLGHCCLASNLKVVGKHVNGLCECGEVKSVLHVLLSCKLYSLQRQKLFVDFLPLRTILEVGEKSDPFVKVCLEISSLLWSV